jgi:FixJ family two-component response regulator
LACNHNHIYVVDDDTTVLESLRILLESIGITVTTFDRGKKFLAAADLNLGGALLLDINMPGMSGLEVMGRLAELKSNLSVIVVSGRADESEKAYAIKMGALTVLDKPVQLEVLVSAVREALRTA